MRSRGYAEIQRIIREIEPPKPSTRLSALSHASKATTNVQMGGSESCAAGPTSAAADAQTQGAVTLAAPFELPSVVASRSSSVVDLAERRRTDPRSLIRQVRGDLDWIVMKAMEKDRTRRYASASEFAADVGRHVQGEAVSAHPPMLIYRLRKVLIKHRVAALVIVLFGSTLTISTVISTLQYLRAEAAKDRSLLSENHAVQQVERFASVNKLLQGIIEALNPESGQSRGRTINAALTKATEQLDGGLLRENPTDEARLRTLLAGVDDAFGNKMEAEHHLRSAVDLYSAQPAGFGEELVTALYSLSGLFAETGRAAEAVRAAERALEVGRSRLGAEHPRIVMIEFCVAMLHRDETSMHRAIETYQALPAVRRSLENPREQEAAGHLAMLVCMFLHTGDPSLAEPWGRQLIDLDTKLYGAQHWYTGRVSEFQAMALEAGGRLSDAQQLLDVALAIKCKTLSRDAPAVGETLMNSARVLAKQGHYERAAEMLNECLPILDQSPPESWMPHGARAVLGSIRRAQGNLDEAEKLLEAAAVHVIDDPSAPVIRVREVAEALAQLYDESGRAEQAASWRARASNPLPSLATQPAPSGNAP